MGIAKPVLFEFLCGLAVVFLLAVSSSSAAPSKAFKVGMILPLTGIPADYGDSMRKAVELAIRDRPELFSGIRFIWEDSGYDPKQGIQAFKKLHEIDKVDLVYVWGVTFCKSIAPIAQQYQVPLVAQCIDRASAVDRPYVIRFMNYTDQYIVTLLHYLRSKKYKSFGAVLGDNAYAEELFNAFREQLTDDESVTILERYSSGQYELRSTLTRIRSSSYDAIGVFLGLSQIAHFFKQRREQGLNFPTFGTNFFESATEIRASNYTMDGAVYASNVVKESFLRHFTETFGKPSQLAYAALSYEFALLIGELFNHRGELDPTTIISMFERVGRRDGIATGGYDFKNDPRFGRFFDFELTIKIVEGDSVRQLSYDSSSRSPGDLH